MDHLYEGALRGAAMVVGVWFWSWVLSAWRERFPPYDPRQGQPPGEKGRLFGVKIGRLWYRWIHRRSNCGVAMKQLPKM